MNRKASANEAPAAPPLPEANGAADPGDPVKDQLPSTAEFTPQIDAEPNDSLGDVGSIDMDQGPAREASLSYPVVAIGSSAGALQPLKEILSILPANTGMAFVLIPHLAPDHVSYLKEIAEHCTDMPVHAIVDGEQPLQDHVYVLQPGEIARIAHGKFVVAPRDPGRRLPHTIDVFFRSLAEDLRTHAIAVVLSGDDADGAMGLRTIRGEGGVSIVQSPGTTQHSSMPRNSIFADHVDLVASPQEIGVELARLAKQFARAEVQRLESGTESPSEVESFQRILQLLRTQSGLELRQ